jgi:tetratricopeptide (TPR) repeat protein
MDYYDPMSRLKRFPILALLAFFSLLAHAQRPESSAAAPVSSELTSSLFYELLMGELNVIGGDPGEAYALLLDAARKTNDTRLYQRAVDVALQARSGESALMAARAWRQALPESREANRYLLQILIGLNRIGETQEPLKRELAATDPMARSTAIAAMPRFFARASDKQLAAKTVEQALASFLKAPETAVHAWVTVGRMRLEAGDATGALEAARKGQAADPRAQGPALLGLALMVAKTSQAEVIVQKYLRTEALPEVRMEYARALLGAQRYTEAALQLQILTSKHPDYAQAWLIQGVLELQEGSPDNAERSLKKYVDLTQASKDGDSEREADRGLVQAYLSLAQIAEQRKDFAAADDWLKRIDNAQYLLNAQIRRATLMARQGKLDEARELIHNLPEGAPTDARLKVAAEVQLLREAKQFKAAYALLTEAIASNPDDLDFIYDLAMVAEKLGNVDEMERLLRGIITAKPEHQHAYNALGYSLADRNTRLPEAKQLILKALEFAPNDAFINDSLGWVEFRSGNFQVSLQILQAAYKTKPDPEIAAHLGEVLWTMGRRDEATAIWKEGASINAENETLTETLQRLRVKL